ncbi:hypothetical protein [Thiomicrorhabdus indica]|uniref:hypothetical protein n=1 Tax=Thiomicrorhabdus indica TaxID=2267253 RepID=UPI00102DE39C|nr:hypothetical protein [Thiomicrorhabdus indica]
MNEIVCDRLKASENFEFLEEGELREYLEEVSSHIGWIIIFFNSLENIVSFAIADLMTHDPYQDDRIQVFLAEMQYSQKCRTLINLYGQALECCSGVPLREELIENEKLLFECAKRRNGYAHADWIGSKENKLVSVKTKASKKGIFETYKKVDIETVKNDIDFIYKVRDKIENFHELFKEQLYK